MKVMIVDDSVVFRSAIASALEGANEVTEIAKANNGSIAVKKLANFDADIMILDMEMPEMDGIATIKEVRKTNNKVHIILFSGVTSAGAQKTIEALELGADDFLPKPKEGGKSVEENTKAISTVLLPKILQFLPRQGERKKDQTEIISRPKSVVPRAGPIIAEPLKIAPKAICLGSSTGGPEALGKIFKNLQTEVTVPIFIAQHMPPIFTAQLAARLNKLSAINVKEAEQGEIVNPNTCYIAPGDFHMTVVNRASDVVINLDQSPKVNFVRPAVDNLFYSVAEVYGTRSLGIILTGMGEDGLRGCEALKRHHVPIVIQDEESSIVWGMPGAVHGANLYDHMLPLQDMRNVFSVVEVGSKTLRIA